MASDIASLSESATDIGNNVQAVQSALTQVANALAATQTLEQQVSSEAQQGPDGNGTSVCGDAQSVGGDAQSVGGNAQSVGGAAQYVQSSATTIRQQIQQINSDFATFQSDEATLPGFSPPQPTQPVSGFPSRRCRKRIDRPGTFDDEWLYRPGKRRRDCGLSVSHSGISGWELRRIPPIYADSPSTHLLNPKPVGFKSPKPPGSMALTPNPPGV